MVRKYFLICLFLFVNSNLFSQTNNFFIGKVFDSVTREPLPFTTIILKESGLGVFSNADGSFKISCNPDFKYDSLIITYIGYKRTAIAVKNLEQNSVRKIYLKPAIIQLAEVVVIAKHKKLLPVTVVRRAKYQ
jgi:hypothetical protein